MRFAIAFTFLFLFVHSTPAPSRNILAPDSPFDTYGDLCFEDEKARLDNFAIALQQNPDWIGYVVVYAGSQSCAGEAWYRANRAKKWVVSRGIQSDRIVVRDAGYLDDVTTRLQPWPKNKPPYEVLPGRLARSEVKIFRHCRSKIFRPRKCPIP
jgi:hypothetical protein